MRRVHAVWLMVALALAALDVQARAPMLAQVARSVPPMATMHRRPLLAPAVQVAHGADEVQPGDAAIDSALARFAAANAANPAVAAALESASAELTRHPEAYINADGSLIEDGLQGLVIQQFRDTGPVSLPSADGAGDTDRGFSAANGVDVQSLVFIVMMDAAKSAREDLKAIIAATKALNDKKAAQRTPVRASMQAKQDLAVATRGDEDAAKDPAKDSANDEKDAAEGRLDSLSEMSETEQLRLQMAMDRCSKLRSALSNIMKKQSDAANGILGNLK